MARSYALSTKERWEALKTKELDCSVGDAMCTRKACVVFFLKLKQRAEGNEPDKERAIRMCYYHYENCQKNMLGYPLFRNVEVVGFRALT